MMDNLRESVKPTPKKEEQRTLVDILNDMDVLDTQYTPEERNIVTEAQGSNDTWIEYINLDLAKILLGENFDPKCQYKLMTQSDASIVLKIDPTIPENEPPLTNAKGEIIRAHVMEYKLESRRDEVLSYGDMQQALHDSTPKLNYTMEPPKQRKRLSVPVIILAAFVALAVVWVFFMFWVVKLGGF